MRNVILVEGVARVHTHTRASLRALHSSPSQVARREIKGLMRWPMKFDKGDALAALFAARPRTRRYFALLHRDLNAAVRVSLFKVASRIRLHCNYPLPEGTCSRLISPGAPFQISRSRCSGSAFFV